MLWKEISDPIIKMNTNFGVWSTYVVISIFFMCCTKEGNDLRSAEAHPEIKLVNERWDTADRKEVSIYCPSEFHYVNGMKTTNAEDEYNDRLDDYLDDPEDELRFDPEIFDFQDE